MNGSTQLINDQNSMAQLAVQFNDLYLHITSPNISQIGNYRIIQEIGEGAFGKVYLAKHVLLNVEVVLKCGLVDDPNIVREIYYHKHLKHKNIVSLYEVIRTESHLWIVLEYCQGSELYYYICEKKRLDIKETQSLFFQIVLAVRYVHSLNLSHRDLKLENILLADKRRTVVKLTDFGFVREFDPQNRRFLSTICGTTVYMAPELLKSEKYSGFAIDIWSLGVILFTMVYGEMPFDEDDDLKTKYKIIHEEPRYRENVPAHLIQLIQKMLSKDPMQRPNLNEILNSQFLIDIHNRHIEKSAKKYNDTESIVSIHQYYNKGTQPFQERVEKELLKRLQKLNVDIDELQASVYRNEMSPLTAFYELLLTQEFSKKKKKYYRDKQKRYYEAKRTIRKSRKRVKSALSLSDQNSMSNPPLERIISSLSLSSNRNGSKTNLSRLPESRRSSDVVERRGSQSRRYSDVGPNLKVDYLNVSATVGSSPASSRTKVAPTSPREGDSSRRNSEAGPPLHRVVSFVPDDSSRRRLSATVSYEPLKKKSKNGKFIEKLQFWKKTKKDDDVESHNSANSKNTKSTDYSMDRQDDLPLEINVKRNTPSPKSKEGSVEPRLSNGEHAITDGEHNHPGQLKEGFSMNQHEHSHDHSLDTTEIKNIDERSTLPSSPTPPVDLSTRMIRTRPTSMISQMSQLSHLSQMSTMLSESELDILDETDTMDDDYDDDDDAAYESSLNMSQDFNKISAVGMTPTSSSGTNIITTKYNKKRPSYKRNTSDYSSKSSTSKQNKKFSLSQLSSNSSEESSIKSNNNFASPTPTKPSISLGTELDATLAPIQMARANSPDLGKSKRRWTPIFSNSSTPKNASKNNATSSGYNGENMHSYGGGSMNNIMNSTSYFRTSSPPPPTNFNNNNTTKLSNSTNAVFGKKQKKPSPVLMSNGFLANNKAPQEHPLDTRWENNYSSSIPTSTNNHTTKNTGYEPVIDEEDENEY
ncbi:serine/threonine protein kinase [Scheffersomyces xylosifermentans]|uniref:serine/threonine protein kinase n=1 Tax=Scheffersomyces xylosifermentans TaxID=1304137 RepID=UPI00315D8763